MAGAVVASAARTYAATGPADDFTTRSTVDTNAGWSWFSGPEAVCYAGTNRRMYGGFIRGVTSYDVMAFQYDLDSHALATFTLNTNFERDDHDNPSFCVLGNGKILACYCKHNDTTGVRYRITSSAESIAAWTAEATVAGTGSANTSYSNLHRVTSEGRVYLFYRGASGVHTVCYYDETGGTWSTPAQCFEGTAGQRPYAQYASDGTKIHLWITDGHPHDMSANSCSIYHLYYDSADGNWHKSDGTVTKSMATVLGGTKLTATDATKVHNAATGGNAWTWSIELDGSGLPAASYTTFPTADDHRYRYARWSGSAWSTEEITTDGPSLYGTAPTAEEYYSAGVTVDPRNVNRVYLSKQVSGVFELQRWTTPGAWVKETDITTGSTGKGAARPVVPRNWLAGAPYVLWNQYAAYNNFSSWDAALKASPAL